MKRTLLQRFALWLLEKSRAEKFIILAKVEDPELKTIDLSYTTTYPYFTDIEHNPAYQGMVAGITKRQREVFRRDIHRYFDRHLDDLIRTEVSGSQIRMSLRLYYKDPLTPELKEL